MDTNRHMQMLGPVDAAFWYLDSDVTPMNIGSLMILDGHLDFEALIDHLDVRLHLAPLYQQRVISALYNTTEPTWIFDTDFHIRYHVRRVTLASPGDDTQLRALAGELISGRLNPEKPLWMAYVIEGLSDNRTGLLVKVHHCMVDGISAIELFSLLLDFGIDETQLAEKPLYNPPPTPTDFDLLQEAFRRSLPHRWDVLKHIGHDVLKFSLGLLEREQRRKTLNGLVTLANDYLTPIKKLPINGANTGKLAFAWSEFPLKDIKAIRKARLVSINDVMLTILGTAIARYTEETGNPTNQDFVRIIVPVDMRKDEGVAVHDGNRISIVPMEVPFYTLDILDRLGKVADYSRLMKEANIANNLDIVFTLPALPPAVLQPLIWSVVPDVIAASAHMWVTNVPGPQLTLSLLGHNVLHINGFFPLNPGMGLASVILSYDGRITISLVADEAIVPDLDLLRRFVEDAFTELCDAVGITPSSTPRAVASEPTVPPVSETLPFGDKPDPLPEALPVFEGEVHALNGAAAATTFDVIRPAVQIDPVEAPVVAVETAPEPEIVPGKPRLMSAAWAQQLQEALNTSTAYYTASTKWTAGALALVMKADAAHDYPTDVAVVLDLYRGKCRSAQAVPVSDAYRQAAFVLEGSYASWMEVLEERAQPIPMIMKGKLKLRQGALARLLPFTRSAQALVACAIQIS
ncbi:MAG: hypothetical protein OHK0046_42850 [Anaerolineae bacterium]